MKTTYSNPAPEDKDDLAAEYAFDYTKAKPNRFATPDSSSKMTVRLDGLQTPKNSTRVLK